MAVMLQLPNLVKSDLVFNERLTEFSVDIYKHPALQQYNNIHRIYAMYAGFPITTDSSHNPG